MDKHEYTQRAFEQWAVQIVMTWDIHNFTSWFLFVTLHDSPSPTLSRSPCTIAYLYEVTTWTAHFTIFGSLLMPSTVLFARFPCLLTATPLLTHDCALQGRSFTPQSSCIQLFHNTVFTQLVLTQQCFYPQFSDSCLHCKMLCIHNLAFTQLVFLSLSLSPPLSWTQKDQG